MPWGLSASKRFRSTWSRGASSGLTQHLSERGQTNTGRYMEGCQLGKGKVHLSHIPAHAFIATVAPFRAWRGSQLNVAGGPRWSVSITLTFANLNRRLFTFVHVPGLQNSGPETTMSTRPRINRRSLHRTTTWKKDKSCS